MRSMTVVYDAEKIARLLGQSVLYEIGWPKCDNLHLAWQIDGAIPNINEVRITVIDSQDNCLDATQPKPAKKGKKR